jgi:iron complex outermembrane receptor protein
VYRGTTGDRVALGSFAPPARLDLEGSDIVSGGNVVAGWERELPARTTLRLQAYYDRTVRQAIHFGEERDTLDVDLLLRTPIGRRHQVSWGGGARSSHSDFTSKHPAVSFVPEDRNQRLASVYGQDEIALLPDKLFATIGTKLEHNTYTGWEVQPSARLLWRADTQETVWAGITRGVRTPSRFETEVRVTQFSRLSPLVYAQLAGSPGFDAETLVGVEAGYRRLISPSLYLDVTAFHNSYQSLSSFGPFAVSIQALPIPHALATTTYQNGIRATSDGFEISPDWRPRGWVRVRGSYALVSIDATNRPGFSDAANVALYEGSVPRHQASVQASLTLPNRVEVDYAQRAVGRLVSHSVPRYVTGDARVAWDAGRGFTLAVAGQNLFAPRHREFFRDDFPQPGVRRSMYVSATWRR